MKQFDVWFEGGGLHRVFANDDKEAVEAYFDSVQSIVGHQMGFCDCYGNRDQFDRSRVKQPIRVVEVAQDMEKEK